MRAKAAKEGNNDFAGLVVDDEDTPYRKACRSRWAALIQKVYEVDPLRCPKCQGEMKIIAFIESRDQPDVVEKILRHCDLWIELEPGGPPNLTLAAEEINFILESEYIPMDEFLANHA